MIVPAKYDGKYYNTNVHLKEGATITGYGFGGGHGAEAVVSGTAYFDILGGTAEKDVSECLYVIFLLEFFQNGQMQKECFFFFLTVHFSEFVFAFSEVVGNVVVGRKVIGGTDAFVEEACHLLVELVRGVAWQLPQLP